MSSSPPNPTAASARALFRQSKLAASSSNTQSSASSSPARIHHPFAAYDAQSRLKCTLCDTLIKSVAGWKPHLASPEHKVAIARRQQQRAAPAVKRRVTEAGVGQGGSVAKVAKTSAAASAVTAARAAAAAAALATYASSDDGDEEEQADGGGDRDAGLDSDSDGGGALPAGFFDNQGDDDESDSDSDSEPPSAGQPTAPINDDIDDADLLAFDIPDDDTLASPANLAAAIFDAQVDDGNVKDSTNGHTHPPPAQPEAQEDTDPDSVLFASLTADRADAETRTQSELVERLRRLRTQRGLAVDDEEEGGGESSDDDAATTRRAHQQGARQDPDAGDESGEEEDEEEDWSWRMRGMQRANT